MVPAIGARTNSRVRSVSVCCTAAQAAATPLCAALAPPPEATLAYREWLHQRLGWRADR
jgi:hypothetical protein